MSKLYNRAQSCLMADKYYTNNKQALFVALQKCVANYATFESMQFAESDNGSTVTLTITINQFKDIININ